MRFDYDHTLPDSQDPAWSVMPPGLEHLLDDPTLWAWFWGQTDRPDVTEEAAAASTGDELFPYEQCVPFNRLNNPMVNLNGTNITARRLAYTLWYGAPPEGQIRTNTKRCGRYCVNPLHLRDTGPPEPRQPGGSRGKRGRRPHTIDDRIAAFWEKVEPGIPADQDVRPPGAPCPPPGTGDCLLWMGATRHGSKGGAGVFKWNGKPKSAVNIAYFLAHHRWPSKQLRNLCGSTICVNHEHWR